MAPPWHFFLNPAAGRGRALRAWTALLPLLRRDGLDFVLHTSTPEGGLTRLVREADVPADQPMVIIGGDGSMHEALNGLLQLARPADQLPVLRLLPAGSGNDWARWWQIPAQPLAWWQQAPHWPIHPHNAGSLTCQLNGQERHRYFLNVAGLAYDAWLVGQIEARPEIKGHPLLYISRVLRWMTRYQPQAASVHLQETTRQGRFYTINAGICPYSGGGMRLVPHARPDHDTLAITLAADLPLSRIFRNIHRFYTGTIGSVKGVTLHHSTFMDVHSDDALPLQVEADGEWLGYGPCRISLLPAAFRVAAPGQSRPAAARK